MKKTSKKVTLILLLSSETKENPLGRCEKSIHMGWRFQTTRFASQISTVTEQPRFVACLHSFFRAGYCFGKHTLPIRAREPKLDQEKLLAKHMNTQHKSKQKRTAQKSLQREEVNNNNKRTAVCYSKFKQWMEQNVYRS